MQKATNIVYMNDEAHVTRKEDEPYERNTSIKQCLAKFDSKQYHCTSPELLKLSAIASELTVALCIWTTAMEVTPTI